MKSIIFILIIALSNSFIQAQDVQKITNQTTGTKEVGIF